jgi:hypothetical protein
MQAAGPGSAMRTGTSGQLSGVTVTGRSPCRVLRNPRRLRVVQETRARFVMAFAVGEKARIPCPSEASVSDVDERLSGHSQVACGRGLAGHAQIVRRGRDLWVAALRRRNTMVRSGFLGFRRAER